MRAFAQQTEATTAPEGVRTFFWGQNSSVQGDHFSLVPGMKGGAFDDTWDNIPVRIYTAPGPPPGALGAGSMVSGSPAAGALATVSGTSGTVIIVSTITSAGSGWIGACGYTASEGVLFGPSTGYGQAISPSQTVNNGLCVSLNLNQVVSHSGPNTTARPIIQHHKPRILSDPEIRMFDDALFASGCIVHEGELT
jgi:hypothetical protein